MLATKTFDRVKLKIKNGPSSRMTLGHIRSTYTLSAGIFNLTRKQSTKRGEARKQKRGSCGRDVGSSYSQPSDSWERYPTSCFETKQKEIFCMHTPALRWKLVEIHYSVQWLASSDDNTTLLKSNKSSDLITQLLLSDYFIKCIQASTSFPQRDVQSQAK